MLSVAESSLRTSLVERQIGILDFARNATVFKCYEQHACNFAQNDIRGSDPPHAAIGLRYPKNSRFVIRWATSGGTICSHLLSPDCNFASTSGG